VDEEINRLQADLARVREEQKVAVQAQVRGMRAGMDPVVYEELFTDLASRQAKVEERLTFLRTRPKEKNPETTAEQYEVVMGAVRDALSGEELTPAEKHTILSTVIVQIVPREDGTIAIRLRPMSDSVNNIQWFRRWDEWSEDELGVPRNGDKTTMSDQWRRDHSREELPGR
jgi:hypothetical protein